MCRSVMGNFTVLCSALCEKVSAVLNIGKRSLSVNKFSSMNLTKDEDDNKGDVSFHTFLINVKGNTPMANVIAECVITVLRLI